MNAIYLWIGIGQQAAMPKLTLPWAFALAMLVAGLSALPVIAQQPSEDSGADTTKSDAITGRVVNENGQPIANANVFVRAFDSQESAGSTTTDSEGNFRVGGLEAGSYQVFASVPAFTPAPRDPANSQRRYYRVGDSVHLELLKGGVITGTVTTSTGEPVVAARVHATMVRDGYGKPPRYGAQSRQRVTDDRGIYRIYGLPTGTYVVSVGGGGHLSGYNPLDAYETTAPIYAPSSGRKTAREISVRAGEETTNVDIRYRAEPGFIISGSARDPRSPAAEHSWSIVTLSSINAAFPQENLSTYQFLNGQGFALYGVVDGDYVITAQSRSGGEWAVSESRPIKVRGADLTGIDLITKPLGSIAGRVSLEESKAPECKGKRRHLFAETVVSAWHSDKETKDQPSFLWALGGPSTPKKDGAFTLRNLAPGQYRLDTRFFAKYWYVSSIALPASFTTQGKLPAERLSDAAQNWIAVKLGDRVSGLVITLAEGAASIQGQVRIPEGQKPPPWLSVFLVPSELENAKDVLRFFVAPASEGNFAINNLPPGRYWAMARSAGESEPDLQSKLRLPDQAEVRAKLRQEIEAAKTEISLKPCQNVTNYLLPLTGP